MANVLAKFNFDKRFCGKTDLICDAWQEKIFHIFYRIFQTKKWYFVTKIVLTYCEQKNVLVIEKNFRNSRLKAETLQNF